MVVWFYGGNLRAVGWAFVTPIPKTVGREWMFIKSPPGGLIYLESCPSTRPSFVCTVTAKHFEISGNKRTKMMEIIFERPTETDWTTRQQISSQKVDVEGLLKAVMKHYEMHIVISLWYAKMAIVLTFKPFYWYVQRPNAFVKRITVHCASNKLGLCLGTILYLLLSYEVF